MNARNYTWNTMRWVAFVCLLATTSCLKVDTILTDHWQPEIALPLINTTIFISDFLNNTEVADYFEVDSNNFITLIYEDKVPSPKAEDFITIDDFGMIIPDSVVGIPPSFFPFPYDLKHVTLKQGTLSYTITSNIEKTLDLNVQFINIRKDGHIFAQYNTIEYTGTLPRVVSGSLDLIGQTLDFSGHFVVMYRATDNEGNRYELDGLDYTFQNLEFSYIDGSFEGREFELPSRNFMLDILDRSGGGEIYLENPKVHLDIRNSIGLPVAMSSVELQARNSNGTIIPFNSPLNNGIGINYPELDQVGQSSSTRITLDQTNSNILEVINAFPNQVDYTLKGSIMALPADSLGFARDTGSIDVNFSIELPLMGRIKALVYESVKDIDPTDLMEANNIEFKLIAENGFPLEIDFQVYFLNTFGQVVDSLANAGNPIFVTGAEVGADGRVTSPDVSEFTIIMQRDKINNLEDVTQLKTQARIYTLDNGDTSVRIYNDYQLKLKLGAKALIQ